MSACQNEEKVGSADCKDLDAVAEGIRSYFSGNVDFAGNTNDIKNTKVRVISTTTTVSTNPLINGDDANPDDDRFRFVSLAVDDKKKLDAVLKEVGADKRIAILYEYTSFGRGAMTTLKRLKSNILHASFPPNIAGLRKRMRDSDESNKQKLGLVGLTADDAHLPIEESVENGNEYPDGGRSALTTVSADQQLRQLMVSLREYKNAPQVVIVAATDVRDRLYLFDRLGRELPGAQLVDLEADLLLAHPDYVHATRGALMLSSAPLAGNGLSALEPSSHAERETCPRKIEGGNAMLSFDSDRQALTYWLMRCLDEIVARNSSVVSYRIGRNGPIPWGWRGDDSGWIKRMRGGYAGGLTIAYGLLVLVAALAAGLCGLHCRAVVSSRTGVSACAPWWNTGIVGWGAVGIWSTWIVGIAVLLLPLVVQHPQAPDLASQLFGSTQDGWARALQSTLAILALAGLLISVAIGRRLRRWASYAETLVRTAGGGDLRDWSTIAGPKPSFVSTPLEAGFHPSLLDMPGDDDSGNAPRTRQLRRKIDPDDKQWQARILEFEAGFEDSLAMRMALRRLLWPSLRALNTIAIAIVLLCTGVLMMSLLYPVPHRGLPMTLGLVVAVLGTVHVIACAIAFERNSLLSRLFCGTDKGLQLSTQFMAVVLSPVVLLILSIIAADQPGVLEWSGGLAKILTGGR
jgi:hypothetical protein